MTSRWVRGVPPIIALALAVLLAGVRPAFSLEAPAIRREGRTLDAIRWLNGPFADSWKILWERAVKKEVTGKEFLAWVERIVRPIEPSFSFQIPVEPDQPVQPNQLSEFYEELLKQVLIPRGYFASRSPFGKGPLIGRLEPADECLTPSGRKVPVYLAHPIQGIFPRGMASSEFIILSRREEESFERMFPLWKGWWTSYEREHRYPVHRPAPSQNQPEKVTRFLQAWIFMNAFGKHDLAQAKQRFRESVLAEEAAHSDAEAFAGAVRNRKLRMMVPPMEAVWTARQILKPGRLSKGLESLKDRPIEIQAKEAWAIIEVEGWLKRLELSPDPSFKFLEILQGGPLPDLNSGGLIPIPPQHARGAQLLLPLLSEKLAGKKMSDREWRRFLLEQVMEMDRFNERVRQAAREIYATQFLTLSERSRHLVPASAHDTLRTTIEKRVEAGLEEVLHPPAAGGSTSLTTGLEERQFLVKVGGAMKGHFKSSLRSLHNALEQASQPNRPAQWESILGHLGDLAQLFEESDGLQKFAIAADPILAKEKRWLRAERYFRFHFRSVVQQIFGIVVELAQEAAAGDISLRPVMSQELRGLSEDLGSWIYHLADQETIPHYPTPLSDTEWDSLLALQDVKWRLFRPLGQMVQLQHVPTSSGIFVPSDMLQAAELLKEAKVGPDSYVFDPGVGTGEPLLVAAVVFGARGMGRDIQDGLVQLGRRWIRELPTSAVQNP